MRTETDTDTDARDAAAAAHGPARLVRRVSRLEWVAAGCVAIVMVGLVAAEPDILDAPFENSRTMMFTLGGTGTALVALVVMLWLGVRPVIRLLVLGVPFVAVSWWLISPFFLDDVVNDEFTTSIADARAGAPVGEAGPSTTASSAGGPVLLGSGAFVGLAGHEGSGDAGFFVLEDGGRVLRLENFDIQNGPDLRLYVVAGGGRTKPGADSLDLGALRGTIGDQTYDLPAEFTLAPGDWTVLVWCEAFSVEFAAATITVA